MSADDRRDLVKSLWLEALAREGGARAAYLDALCAGDPDLRDEVESLLKGQAALAWFLAASPGESAAALVRPGTLLGPYRLAALVGAGGMGEVYKARDTRLDRLVAVKVLPPRVVGNAAQRPRFEREARTIAALNHPNICTLHDIGEHQGQRYV